MRPTREQAWQTLTQYTSSEALLRHALAVEASVAFYARRDGEDEELWRATALLHDFDYEIHPTLDKHPQDGAPILREEGYPEELIEAVLSHAEHLAMPRDTQLKKVLFACDELSGFVHACGLVRPTGVDHEVVIYDGAPHSFFDRKHEEFAADSEDAWNRVLAFLRRYC